MFFCENCGSKLSDDARFCENCGYRIPYNEPTANAVRKDDGCFSVFESADWKADWRARVNEKGSDRTGLILTNTRGCTGESVSLFRKALQEYVNGCMLRGTGYYVVDIATQRVRTVSDEPQLSEVLALLREIYGCITPKYLMIVGDRDSIPSAKWANPLTDRDEYVDSDLCYWTLDTTSPFERSSGTLYARVGRIPSSHRTGFAEARRYFATILSRGCFTDSINSVAMSEVEWFNVSAVNFENSCQELYPCPPNTFVNYKEQRATVYSDNYNMLCFNLHGSSAHDFWISGSGVPGYSADSLPHHGDPYVICTEACYGAKPVVRHDGTSSILMTALQDGCIAFCGSTQIAYGISDTALQMGAKPCAADVVIGKFAEDVSCGATSGQAYANALLALLDIENGMDPEDVKTLASFALYGDPSLRFLVEEVESYRDSSFEDDLYSATGYEHRSGTTIRFPDVRLAVNKRISSVSEKISKSIDHCLNTHFKQFKGISPTYYERSGLSGYKAALKKTVGNRTDYLNIYVDRQGAIKKIYVSK